MNWKRFGLDILGKYENDVWVGAWGYGDWCIAYHGTYLSNLQSILYTGLRIGGLGD